MVFGGPTCTCKRVNGFHAAKKLSYLLCLHSRHSSSTPWQAIQLELRVDLAYFSRNSVVEISNLLLGRFNSNKTLLHLGFSLFVTSYSVTFSFKAELIMPSRSCIKGVSGCCNKILTSFIKNLSSFSAIASSNCLTSCHCQIEPTQKLL